MQETVLLVHGVLMTARVMAVLARRLRGCGYRTVLFDYPTRGRCLRDNAHSLARFVGGLGSPTVHLVGHSMGGVTALLLAERHRSLVRGVVDIDGNKSPDDCTFSSQAAAQGLGMDVQDAGHLVQLGHLIEVAPHQVADP